MCVMRSTRGDVFVIRSECDAVFPHLVRSHPPGLHLELLFFWKRKRSVPSVARGCSVVLCVMRSTRGSKQSNCDIFVTAASTPVRVTSSALPFNDRGGRRVGPVNGASGFGKAPSRRTCTASYSSACFASAVNTSTVHSLLSRSKIIGFVVTPVKIPEGNHFAHSSSLAESRNMHKLPL